MIAETGQTYIGKVRAFSRERDSLALRLSLSNLLSVTDLHPPNLPYAAILCIRRLRDPLPGKLRPRRGDIRPSHAWEQALGAELQRLVAQAAHPIREEVATDANAVLFADRAEMLACLASDWCRGKLATRWWWRSLFQGRDVPGQLIPAWLDRPEYVPAALHHLAVRREALPFMRHLSEQAVRTLLNSITHRFALSTLQTAIEDFAPAPWYGQHKVEAVARPSTLSPATPSEQHFSAGQVSMVSEHSSPERPGALPPAMPRPSASTRQQPDSHRLPPWQTWVPESSVQEAHNLSIEQQLLLGIGLMLQRAPTVVRSASFAFAVRQWRAAAMHPTLPAAPVRFNDAASAKQPYPSDMQAHKEAVVSSNDVQEHSSRVAKPSFETETLSETPSPAAGAQAPISASTDDHTGQPALRATSNGEQAIPATASQYVEKQRLESSGDEEIISEGPVAVPGQAGAIPLTAMSGESIQSASTHEFPAALTDQALKTASVADAPSNADRSTQPEAVSRQEMMHNTSSPELPASSPEVSATVQAAYMENQEDAQARSVDWHESTIETAWGGIFYLINLGLFLELYGDFTTPAQPGIPLTIWDFLTLVGYWLLGEKLRADPIWKLLSQLAGRQEGEPPGQHFEPPGCWRLPPAWLSAFPSDERDWRWEASDGHLRVFHPGGFTVIDVPLEPDVSAQLACEMAVYDTWEPVLSPAASQVETPVAAGYVEGVAPQIRRWLDWLMPYIYARLQRAFGSEDSPVQTLCQHHARVYVTAAHLDVLLSLAELPVEIRFSGLDRNAGWVPAAGRYVTFYFE